MIQWRYIPNALTILRLLLIIPFTYYLHESNYRGALCMFMLAGLTDSLDGFLARRFRWTSHLGSFLDPLADKLLVMTAVVALTLLDKLPFWVFFIMFVRDAILMSGIALLRLITQEKIDYAPTFLSKVNTVLALGFLTCLLVELSYHALPLWFVTGLMWAVVTTTLLSLADYGVAWWRIARK